MGAYKITFKPSVEKDLGDLPKAMVLRVMKRIEGLGENPFPPQSIKLSSGERLYRVRVGDYRIVYEVEGRIRQITIHYVRHRREVYRHIS